MPPATAARACSARQPRATLTVQCRRLSRIFFFFFFTLQFLWFPAHSSFLVTALPNRLACLNHSSFKTLAHDAPWHASFASRPWGGLLLSMDVAAASCIVTVSNVPVTCSGRLRENGKSVPCYAFLFRLADSAASGFPRPSPVPPPPPRTSAAGVLFLLRAVRALWKPRAWASKADERGERST